MHEQFVSLATRLIDRNGRSLVLVSGEKSGPRGEQTSVDMYADVTAVQLSSHVKEVDGRLVRVSGLFFLMDASVEPQVDMRIVDVASNANLPALEAGFTLGPAGFSDLIEQSESIDYEIIDVDTLKPGETTIRYVVEAKL